MTGFVLKSNHLVLKHLLHLALALALISFCTSHTTYTISPTCSGNDTRDGTQCLTLSDVAKEPDIYFTTNTTLVFQPGNHSLQETVVPVASINDFTIMSSSSSNESDSRILCNASSFSFTSVSDLQIDSISFVSCQLRLNLTTGRLKSCWFADSYGGAVAVYSGSSLYFSGESRFSSNEAIRGVAMVIDSSNLTFSGNSTFSNNRGGLYISNHSVVTVKGSAVFMNNSAQSNGSGGAVHAFYNNTITFSGTSVFYNNTSERFGGGLYFYDSNIANFNGNSSFCNNTANLGGALHAESNNTVKFNGSSVFCNNYVPVLGRGGAVFCRRSNKLSFEGSHTFYGNRAGCGGAIRAVIHNTVNISGTSAFYNNTSVVGGALAFQLHNIANVNGNTSFLYNTAEYAAAVYGRSSNIMNFGGNITFLYGIALYSGGAVYVSYNNSVRLSGTSTFRYNTARQHLAGALFAHTTNFVYISGTSTFYYNKAPHGGAVAAFLNNTVSFDGLNAFRNNTAVINGGAVYSGVNNIMHFSRSSSFTGNAAKLLGGGLYAASDTNVTLIGSPNFMWNRASYGGGIFVQGGRVTICTTCAALSNNIAIFSGNSASESGGAMLTRSGRVILNGSILVTGNTAKLGGGLAMSGFDRVLLLQPNTQMSISGNKAIKKGGAIYIEDNPLTYCSLMNSLNTDTGEACFFQLYQEDCAYVGGDLSNHSYTGGAHLVFVNNTATESGSAIYGGSLEDCGVCFPKSGPWHEETKFQLGKNALQDLAGKQNIRGLDIASEPYKVCVCNGNVSDCSSRTTNVTYYPGETLSIRVVATGQMNGIVPSIITAVSKGIQLTSAYKTQDTNSNRNCTELHYPLLTSNEGQHVSLELYSSAPSGIGYTLNIYINPCPTGFAISDQGNCSCADRLRKYTQECNITSQTITRLGGSTFWVGLDYHNNTASRLILNPHCPFDYCTDETVYFSMNETDTQCSNRRSGILCGACQTGYSLALGTSRCIPNCSNLYLALLLAFAVAGLLLVLLLFFCNLTVAEGSISGLIFYANMLAVNPSVFMPPSYDRSPTMKNFLSVFIAWLNLDFGIETCFFTGLDTYSRTWLQFAFPLYIWLLVGMIVCLARVSTTAAKLLATTNPVAVLATLLLLSYTKLLHTIMAAFSFTTLSYPEEKTKVVWLYDGNIGYWDGKHLILLLVSLLIFVIFFIPYTLFLLCGQWIQRNVQLRCVFRAMFCMKYFCDVYSAPYKARQSYWTGLLFLARFIVLLVSTIGSPQDPHTNLLVLIIVVSFLIVMAWINRGVYKKWYLDFLEASFLFNLLVLSVSTYQIHLSGSNQAAFVNTSMIIAFIIFVVIIAGTLLQHLRKTCLGNQLFLQQLRHPNYQALEDQQEEPREPCQAPPVPTASIVDIDRNRMSDFAKCRNAERHGLY